MRKPILLIHTDIIIINGDKTFMGVKKVGYKSVYRSFRRPGLSWLAIDDFRLGIGKDSLSRETLYFKRKR